ncbi:MAG TPA: hypothetical protein VF472_09765 [Burkholderiaceae bacterium]
MKNADVRATIVDFAAGYGDDGTRIVERRQAVRESHGDAVWAGMLCFVRNWIRRHRVPGFTNPSILNAE